MKLLQATDYLEMIYWIAHQIMIIYNFICTMQLNIDFLKSAFRALYVTTFQVRLLFFNEPNGLLSKNDDISRHIFSLKTRNSWMIFAGLAAQLYKLTYHSSRISIFSQLMISQSANITTSVSLVSAPA